jgi:hypothetical protein
MAVSIEFEVDGSLLSFSGIEALNGFTTMNTGSGAIAWTNLGNDIYKGKVTLLYKAGTGESISSGAELDIAKFSFGALGLGDATMKITKVEVSGMSGDNAVYFNSAVENAEATTSIVEGLVFSIYDLNKDGVVDMLDLTIVMLYCQYNSGDNEWDTLIKAKDSKGNGITASLCDFNDDGIVNMLDLVELFLNYTSR